MAVIVDLDNKKSDVRGAFKGQFGICLGYLVEILKPTGKFTKANIKQFFESDDDNKNEFQLPDETPCTPKQYLEIPQFNGKNLKFNIEIPLPMGYNLQLKSVTMKDLIDLAESYVEEIHNPTIKFVDTLVPDDKKDTVIGKKVAENNPDDILADIKKRYSEAG